jgi:hypothetical protein
MKYNLLPKPGALLIETEPPTPFSQQTISHEDQFMSHHYSGPDTSFPHGDARLDLTDRFIFPKPGDARKSILIMNVHPSSALDPSEPTRLDPFASDAVYELKIDTDGDAIADIAYRVRFSQFANGAQTAMEPPQVRGSGGNRLRMRVCIVGRVEFLSVA